MSTQAKPHRVVVVGGGAGGLELATALGNRYSARRKKSSVQVVLVDRYPSHIWKPLLHEIAAGSMDPSTHQLSYAAQASWHGFEFQQGELTGLSRSERTIAISATLDSEGMQLLPERVIGYDTLVLAIGSVTNFFNVPGAKQYASALDSAPDAERFHRRLIAACVRARIGEGAVPGAERKKISIAIIGAGATGVELSAELRNTAHVLKAYGVHDLDAEHDLRIAIVEAGPRILPALTERVAANVTELLGRAQVEVLTGERVIAVESGQVVTASGRVVPSDLTVWAAGIIGPPVLAQLDGLALDRQGQLIVCDTLQTQSDPNVFAFGDCASCPWLEHGGQVPPRAQAAHQQAKYLAGAIERRLKGQPLRPFRFRDFGSLVSLGHLDAVGNLMGGTLGGSFLIEGFLARMMYTGLYRMHIVALHGAIWMMLDTLGQWLLRNTHPRVKLH